MSACLLVQACVSVQFRDFPWKGYLTEIYQNILNVALIRFSRRPKPLRPILLMLVMQNLFQCCVFTPAVTFAQIRAVSSFV